METIFLAKAFGLYFLVVGIAMFINSKTFFKFYEEIESHRVMILFSGALAFVIGILLVLTHNIWTGGLLHILITLTSWLIFIVGIIRLTFPSITIAVAKGFTNKTSFYITAVIVLILGVYFFIAGFF